MSLILEALRKSEAERRLGQAPDVLAPMPIVAALAHSPRRISRSIATLIVAVAIAIAGVAWWALRLQPNCADADRPTCGPPPSHRTSAAAATTNRVTTAAAPRQQSSTPPSDARAGTHPVSPPIIVPTKAEVEPEPANAPSFEPSQTNLPSASATPIATSTSTPHATSGPASSPTRKPTVAAVAKATRQAASVPSFAGAPPIATPAAVNVPAPAAVAHQDAPDLLPITALPAAERAALPPLKVTMHAYSADPARRFIIIDGQRIVEGGRIADGIMLIHIRRDGGEIDVRGHRLLLPNP